MQKVSRTLLPSTSNAVERGNRRYRKMGLQPQVPDNGTCCIIRCLLLGGLLHPLPVCCHGLGCRGRPLMSACTVVDSLTFLGSYGGQVAGPLI